MIDEYWTWQFYGYHSDELSYGSNRPIVVRCDKCCQYRISANSAYRDLCRSCSLKGHKKPPFTEEHRHNISKAVLARPPASDEARRNMSKSQSNRLPATEKTNRKISETLMNHEISNETRHKISATLQGIPYEEWDGFVRADKYCEKFDEAGRERIRAKHGHKCFICDLPQDKNITKNGKQIKLSVHHIDKNKEQGCNGIKWNLVPLCNSCHGHAHSKTWIARIEYLLANQDVCVI